MNLNHVYAAIFIMIVGELVAAGGAIVLFPVWVLLRRFM